MKKALLALVWGLAALFCPGETVAQEGCSKPKIYVRVALVKGVEKQLNRNVPYRSNDMWASEIMSQVVRELRYQAAGEVEIIALEETVFHDNLPETPKAENAFNERPSGEYHLDFILSGSDAYVAQVSLGDGDMDGVILGGVSIEHPDLQTAIRSSIFRLCGRGLGWLIEEYERTHFNALRGPKFWVNLLEPKYVSPEPGEREVRVSVPTRDCRGLFGRGTNVWVHRKIERGKIDIVKYWKHADPWGDDWKAKTTADGGIDFRFILEKGIEPGVQEVEVYLIGRGQKKVQQVLSIPVKGLKLEVRPDRATVAPGQETHVRIHLAKVDPQGGQEPLPGRKVRIKAEGLVDGQVVPEGEVTTDEKGEGVLTYRAGGSEQWVRFSARYQPEGYPDFLQAEGVVEVIQRLDVNMLVWVKWETHPASGGWVKEEGSCVIQVNGELEKGSSKRAKPRRRRASESREEEISFLPKGDLRVAYKFETRYFQTNPDSKCFGLWAEETAIGIKAMGENPQNMSEPGFVLVKRLDMVGKGSTLQLCGSEKDIQQKILGLLEVPANDNYTFMLTVPIPTQPKTLKPGCGSPPAPGKVFMIHNVITQLEGKDKAMDRNFVWECEASDYQTAAIKECGGTVVFPEPSPGKKYKVRYNLSWNIKRHKEQRP